MNEVIGKPLPRVDGRLKVTGGARYTGDISMENLAYGVIIGSAIAKGRIAKMDTSAAEAAPGVLGILTHHNFPTLPEINVDFGEQSPSILQEDKIYYSGQPVGVVVAESIESATHAASGVKIKYEEEKPIATMSAALKEAWKPELIMGFLPAQSSRGDISSALQSAEVLIEQVYTTPIEHHNPIEPSATLAVWSGDRLTLYDTTQGISSTQQKVAKILGISPENVRVVSEFLGGGFGCKGMTWPHTVLAAIAARHVGRPVKIVLTRSQMYTSCGYRPQTRQQIALGATQEGKLTGVAHSGDSLTSPFDDFIEPVGFGTKMMYASPAVEINHRLGRINAGTPTFTRAPGHASGMFALESAMDELAYALKMDPIELRLRNHADVDPDTGHPWSSKSLKECYHAGAELFGWSRRNPVPGAMGDGNSLLGWGMASATYPALSAPASAKVELFASGEVVVQSGTHDIGTGTYTVMTQIAAENLGISAERVRFELGDTNLPKAPMTGGSMTASSVGPAVKLAAVAARNKVIKLAVEDPRSPLYQCHQADIARSSGQLFLKRDPSKGESYGEILSRLGLESISAEEHTQGNEAQNQYAMHSFGAIFTEVTIDRLLPEIRVTRCVGVYGAGRILNPLTAKSQMIGGIVWGIGMALMENTIMDLNRGRFVNANLSDYLVPVHPDIPDISVQFVSEEDPYVNPLGTKGIGELSIVGTAAAIANAVYHATGKRIRDLPITPDKLLVAL
ncbi:MAG: xanthine dehydrogenase family protein molybdopterin-binding subunit [Hormoscilla sp.]